MRQRSKKVANRLNEKNMKKEEKNYDRNLSDIIDKVKRQRKIDAKDDKVKENGQSLTQYLNDLNK